MVGEPRDDTGGRSGHRPLLRRSLAFSVALLVAACGGLPPATPGMSAGASVAIPAASPSVAEPAASPTSLSPTTPPPSPSSTPVLTEYAQPGYATLDGVAAPDSVGHRLPVAVMIDDNTTARPQYGFNKASIVYQAPADGGEDRYMMVFQEQDATRVEPIRSGRPYFVNWAREYKAAFAHYGGDAKTRAYLPTLEGEIYNIDALDGSGKVFHRDPARSAPHNGYSNTAQIRELAVSRTAPAQLPDGIGVRPFTADMPVGQRPASGSINIPYNRGATSYTYDRGRNLYLRSVAGRPQIDALDRTRVTARNVVVLFMSLSVDPESEPGHARPVVGILGSGKALVFHDGRVVVGEWRKPSLYDVMRLYDADDTEIPLVRGRIFFQVVPLGTKVTYKAEAL